MVLCGHSKISETVIICLGTARFYFYILLSGGSRISPRGRQLPRGGGRQHMILPNFPENCMKLKEFGCPPLLLQASTPDQSWESQTDLTLFYWSIEKIKARTNCDLSMLHLNASNVHILLCFALVRRHRCANLFANQVFPELHKVGKIMSLLEHL